ncbi:hypothetical protein C8R43DRAFT_1037930, partial [Mycena crocata]
MGPSPRVVWPPRNLCVSAYTNTTRWRPSAAWTKASVPPRFDLRMYGDRSPPAVGSQPRARTDSRAQLPRERTPTDASRSHSAERACACQHRRRPASAVQPPADWFSSQLGSGLSRVALRLPGTRATCNLKRAEGGRIDLVFPPTICSPNGSCGPEASSGWSR